MTRTTEPSDRTGDRAAIRPGFLTVASVAAAGAVLLGLFAMADVTIAEDGTLVEPFWQLALGTFALTAAGLLSLVIAFRAVRRRRACARGAC